MVLVSRDLGALGGVTLGDRGQHSLSLGERGVRVVRALDVGPEEAGEVDHVAVGLEDRLDRPVRLADLEHHPAPLGVLHLAGERALPDQVVDLGLVLAEHLADLGGRHDLLASRADGLVGLLRVLNLALVLARRIREELGAVRGLDGVPGQLDGERREHDRVGPHVGDEAVLVQPLGGPHGALRVEAKLAVALLLERGGGERRRGGPGEGLLLGRQDLEVAGVQLLLKRLGPGGVQQRHVIPLQLAGVRVEVLAARDALAAERVQASLKVLAFTVAAGGREARGEVPVLGVHEAHARALTVHDDLGSHALHATGGKARLDLAPEDRRDLVAVQAVKDPSTLLGLDHVLVDLSGVLERLKDRALGDLVEHHVLIGDLQAEHIHQVPSSWPAARRTAVGSRSPR